MPKKHLQFVGNRHPRKFPTLPEFGFLVRDKGTYGMCHTYKGYPEGVMADDPDEVWQYLTQPRTPKLWYTYDLQDLFYEILLSPNVLPPDRLSERLLDSSAKEVDRITIIPRGPSGILRLTIRQVKERPRSARKRDLAFVNMSNIYGETLEELAAGFESPYDTSTLNNKTLSGLYGVLSLLNWVITNLKVRLGTTYSSTVLSALQANWLEDVIPPLPDAYEDFIAKSVVGGQVELYQIYMPHARLYDKNGGYGEASALNLPMKCPYDVGPMSPEELLKMEDLGFVAIDAYVSEYLSNGRPRRRGPLPIRDPSKGTVYPTGHIRSTKEHPAVYFTPLLEEAVRLHEVVIEKIHGGVFFGESEQYLRGWAEYTAQLKQSAKTRGERRLASLAQQILWGKFNQTRSRQVVHIGAVPEERMDDEDVSWPDPELPIWYETVNTKLAHRLPHIASAISSWAHVIGMRDASRLEAFGLQIAYRDTDSWVTSGQMPKDMVGTSLGTYRLEERDCTFVGLAPKLYHCVRGKKVVAHAKGIPAYAPTAQDVDDLLKGKRFTFEWTRPPTVLEALVMKTKYERAPELYEDVIKSFHPKEKRSLPGLARSIKDILDMDTKRKQLSLTESRPLRMSEVRR